MKLRVQLAVAAVLLLTAACSSETPGTSPTGTWVGTITTEGNVTTVVNESGSVWGGRATLVEEMSIGVESGADEYMFGGIQSLYATDDRIVVLDRQLQLVRVYDSAGNFIANVGGPGPGPGEFVYPGLVTMDDSDRVYVLDPDTRRVSQFNAAGGFVTSWEVPGPRCCVGMLYPGPGGQVWIPIEERNRETGESRYGVQGYGSEGSAGDVLWAPEIEFEQPSFDTTERTVARMPFAPRFVWRTTPSGGIVAGASDRYRFEILAPDGSATVVERYWDPGPINPEEREWNRRLVVALQSSRFPGWSWDGAGMPRHKPAFSSLLPAASGEIWVRRATGSRKLDDCMENPLVEFTGPGSIRPCFRSEFTMDVFDRDGRYLGEVETPPGLGLFHANRDVVVGVVEDEAGTIMVKRYRLVLPGEE